MSVSTPSLTTLSEIWAWATPVKAASARPAAAADASNFIGLLPWLYSFETSLPNAVLATFGGRRKAPPSWQSWTMLKKRAAFFPSPLVGEGGARSAPDEGYGSAYITAVCARGRILLIRRHIRCIAPALD